MIIYNHRGQIMKTLKCYIHTKTSTKLTELSEEFIRSLMTKCGYDTEYAFEELLEHIEQEACPCIEHKGVTYEF